MVSTTGKNMFSKPMTTFTPERIEQILEFSEGSNPSEAMSLRADEVAVLARIGKAVMSIAPVYQCEFCHHDATGQLQWHWEDVNKAFYDKYDPDRRGRRRILYTAPPMPLVSADLLNMASSAIEDLLTPVPLGARADQPRVPRALHCRHRPDLGVLHDDHVF